MSLVVAPAYPNYRELPPVWEVAQPFRVDPAGEIAYDVDPYLWARNHLLALLLTSPGERVMRPTYGAGLRSFVFENNDPFVESVMVANIQNAVQQWEPNITIKEMNIVPLPPDWGTYEFRIAFTVGSAVTPQMLAFTAGGTGVEVSTT